MIIDFEKNSYMAGGMYARATGLYNPVLPNTFVPVSVTRAFVPRAAHEQTGAGRTVHEEAGTPKVKQIKD